MLSVVTANHLRTGAVLYLTRDGEWVAELERASPATSPEDLQHLEALARAALERNEVTAVYAFDVRTSAGRIEPVSVRERMRAAHAIPV
jgi:hypothetical protein